MIPPIHRAFRAFLSYWRSMIAPIIPRHTWLRERRETASWTPELCAYFRDVLSIGLLCRIPSPYPSGLCCASSAHSCQALRILLERN